MSETVLTRLQCACAFTDGAKRLNQQLDLVSAKGGEAKVSELRASLAELRALHAAHVSQFGPSYAKSLVELSKGMNPLEMEPLRTAVHGARELLQHRQPPKKLSKGKQAVELRKKKMLSARGSGRATKSAKKKLKTADAEAK